MVHVKTKERKLIASSISSITGLIASFVLVFGDIVSDVHPTYGPLYTWLFLSTGVVSLAIMIIGLLNYFKRSWLRYQILFETVWLGFVLALQSSSVICASIRQRTIGCPATLGSALLLCSYNAVYITFTVASCCCTLTLVAIHVKAIRALTVIQNQSVKEVLLINPRDYMPPSLPKPVHASRPYQTGFTELDWIGEDRYPRARAPESDRYYGYPTFSQYIIGLTSSTRTPTTASSQDRMLPPLPPVPPRVLSSRYYERKAARQTQPRHARGHLRAQLGLPVV